MWLHYFLFIDYSSMETKYLLSKPYKSPLFSVFCLPHHSISYHISSPLPFPPFPIIVIASLFEFIKSMDRQQQPEVNIPINIIVVDSSEDSEVLRDPFNKLRKYSANLFNQELFEDDQFKLPQEKLPKGVVRKRMRDIYPKDTPISGRQGDSGSDSEAGEREKCLVSRPTYLAELKMLPQWHFLSLIEPKCISEQGYYHIAVVQGGRIAKIIIDDFLYYDEVRGEVVAHPFLMDKPWVHIILKAWAKLNKGYDRLDACDPFSFIKTFSFPDWAIFNPCLQELETIISKIGPSSKNDYFYVGKTKTDQKVGHFGLIPNCAAYLITGYYQEYGNIFLKMRSFVGDGWNGCTEEKDIEKPSEKINLGQGEFIIPLKTFINVFHLIYFTTSKYSKPEPLHYNKYTISLDARQSKANFIKFQVLGEGLLQRSTSINFYFPSVKASDYGNHKNVQEGQSLPPAVKICIGRCLQQANMEGSYSYAESLRETILKNEQGYFLNPSNSKFQHIASDYFRGYANEATYHLKLRPGRYIIRLKVEKLLPEYRALLNITSTQDITIAEYKMNKKQQTTFLSQVLSNKARKEQRNVIYPFPHKKQSWIMANDDFDTIGYGSITFQTGKNDNFIMIIAIDNKKLKQAGYRIKNKVELSEVANEMRLKEGESVILILKSDLQYKGERAWPPEGISISYEVIPPRTKTKKTV